MTQPGGTIDSYDAVNRNREDLIDAIYNISPTDTPFLSMIADQASAAAVTHEWQTDTLAAASSSNARIEGDDAGDGGFTATSRLTNVCQISDKVIVVSGTQEAVSKAGPASELAYQREKAVKELKRDMETILTGNQAVVSGSSVAARKLRSLEAWYSTNTSRGVGGANGSTTLAATDASAASVRAFTEDLLKTVLLSCWNAGGNPTHIMCSGFQKQKFSAFTGNATRYDKAEDKTIIASVDVYESDFGKLMVVPNRFSRSRTVHVLEKGFVKTAYLRAFREYPLAKTGDSEKRQMLSEYTLQMSNEAAHGVIADLTTS